MALLGQLTDQSSFDDVAEAIVKECIRRGYSRAETIAVLSTLIQESGLRMVWDPSGRWYGYAQQDGGYPNRMNPNGNITGFLDRLDVKRRSPGRSNDAFLNIFWLQQRPSEPSADQAFRNGRKAYLTEIQGHQDQAAQLFDRFSGGVVVAPPSNEPWRGDPVWLPDVLRAAGLVCDVYPGAFDRGHGDFGEIWGIVAHHTGANPPANNPGYIAQHPSLGLCSQLHLARDGKYTLCGVGIAWHAGNGSYPGLPANDANRLTIGIEAENNGTEGWSPAQYDAYVRGCAAILSRLGHDSSRVIGHKEWAGAAQGKWDPGGIDMNVFRRDVQTHINSGDDDLTPQESKMLNDLWNAFCAPVESESGYADPGEGKKWTRAQMISHNNKFGHERYVEETAKLGDKDALDRLFRSAAGDGKVKSEDWIARSKNAIDAVPDEVAAKYLADE